MSSLTNLQKKIQYKFHTLTTPPLKLYIFKDAPEIVLILFAVEEEIGQYFMVAY